MSKEIIVYNCSHAQQVAREGDEWVHVRVGGRLGGTCDGTIFRSRAEVRQNFNNVIRERVQDDN